MGISVFCQYMSLFVFDFASFIVLILWIEYIPLQMATDMDFQMSHFITVHTFDKWSLVDPEMTSPQTRPSVQPVRLVT